MRAAAALLRYGTGVVNPGENFVSFVDGRWIDWSEEVNKLSGLEGCDFIAYDNLPIKGYSYPLSEVEEIHDLSRKVKTVNGETPICPTNPQVPIPEETGAPFIFI